jgi:hypothetical protein
MMDANELRALQAPLKKYREQPATALTRRAPRPCSTWIASHAECAPGAATPTLACIPPPAATGSLACSADMMLEALVACAGVTVSAVATAMGVKLRGGRVVAEGTGTRAARWASIAKRRSALPILR